ncbi:(2Fe-2S)-binding protein [Tumidithrix helvetica PCC 7403]|uniref:2Fe-2S iron-sulfur cluster-binding protein n=1 Tax=Tumidithrix helvetica TaxID=3457545 RepID=UPI003CBE2AB3
MNTENSLLALQIDGQLTSTPKGTRLLGVLLANNINVLKACGGQGRCATCHVFIHKGMDSLTPPTEQELMTLSLMRIEQSNARLACQCMVLGSGVSLEVPKGKYVDSDTELESQVGKKAEQSLIHPITGEVLVYEGKLILRTALQKMQTATQEFEQEMKVYLTRNSKKEK